MVSILTTVNREPGSGSVRITLTSRILTLLIFVCTPGRCFRSTLQRRIPFCADDTPTMAQSKGIGANAIIEIVRFTRLLNYSCLKDQTRKSPRRTLVSSGASSSSVAIWRRRADSNRRIEVLQTSALNHLATSPHKYFSNFLILTQTSSY